MLVHKSGTREDEQRLWTCVKIFSSSSRSPILVIANMGMLSILYGCIRQSRALIGPFFQGWKSMHHDTGSRGMINALNDSSKRDTGAISRHRGSSSSLHCDRQHIL